MKIMVNRAHLVLGVRLKAFVLNFPWPNVMDFPLVLFGKKRHKSERDSEKEREQEEGGEYIYAMGTALQCESDQSGPMHVNEGIDCAGDQCCIYNAREG